MAKQRQLKFDRLIRGDCVEQMRKLPEGCLDLVFADPPYNIGYSYDEYDDRRDCDDYLDWCGEWTSEIARLLKPDGTFWLAIGDEYAAEMKVMLTRQNEERLKLRSWVIWYYTFGVNCTHKFSRSHAHLLYFVKDPKNFTFNADDPDVRVPSARQLVYGDKRANPKGRLPDDTWVMIPNHDGSLPEVAEGDEEKWVLRPQDAPTGFRDDGSVWYFPRVAGTFKQRAGWHGCQMPEQLLGRIIRSCSNEGDIVFDPFAGSGTTLAVAKKLGRSFLGCEMSKDYARQAEKRLSDIVVGDPLTGPENPLVSAPSTKNGRRLSNYAK
ncbi:DNA-methyltransferase [Stratiformator vulcanicus]|uniref:Methyltransferase n=1 Tax=Stratiformator vulcanicus TaxID=2527980 RepID=A0A517R6V7_9PLAN|nr:site-specific DNA-methyltransferase [Stratiformator vulcanicus]QDT39582.1 DNA adenine methyltransferase YhdJ [Stratiformator vulcanicus]